MNKEKYNQIVDEVFKKYGDSHWTPPKNPDGPLLVGQLWSVKPMQHSKEIFINKCKTDKEFSERWDFKIEERELSRQERYEHLRTHKYSGKWDGIGDAMEYYNSINVPTKLITVTYNNETIEVYE
jgi:hypothetical protein